MIEHVKAAGHIQFQSSGDALCLRLRLPLDLLVEVSQDGHILRFGVGKIGTVDGSYRSVDEGLLHRIQTAASAGRQLAEGQDEVGFQRQWVIILGIVEVQIHGIDKLTAGGGNLDHLPAQTMDQRKVLRLRVTDKDIVLGHQEYIENLPFGREGFAAARRTQDHAVGCFQLLAVGKDHVAGGCVNAVV